MPYTYWVRENRPSPKAVIRRTPALIWEMVGVRHPDGWWTDPDYHAHMVDEMFEGTSTYKEITPQRAKEIIVSNGWKASIS